MTSLLGLGEMISIRFFDGKWYKVYQRCGIDERGYFIEQETVEWQ